ncbi:Gnk2-homologous domain protein [Raphanus sativus]|nr:Gnk2-homologous domain protein [Raphanus sativus]
MSSYACFIFLFLFSFLNSFRVSAQDPTYISHVCPNTTTYTRNSTYSTNLQTLLSSLSSPNASYATGFQNATLGEPPDRVSGYFTCFGVSPELCRSCVAFSVDDALIRCPNEKDYKSHKNLKLCAVSGDSTFSKPSSSPTPATMKEEPSHHLKREIKAHQTRLWRTEERSIKTKSDPPISQLHQCFPVDLEGTSKRPRYQSKDLVVSFPDHLPDRKTKARLESYRRCFLAKDKLKL